MAEWMARYYDKCHTCAHPMSAHTSSIGSIPFTVCARFVLKEPNTATEHYDACGCKLLAGVNDDEL